MHILQINYSTYLYANHFSNSLSSYLNFFLNFDTIIFQSNFTTNWKPTPLCPLYYTLIISKLFKWSMTRIVV